MILYALIELGGMNGPGTWTTGLDTRRQTSGRHRQTTGLGRHSFGRRVVFVCAGRRPYDRDLKKGMPTIARKAGAS